MSVMFVGKKQFDANKSPVLLLSDFKKICGLGPKK